VYQLQIYDMRYQIQIQGVLETDTRCTRYGVYQIHGVLETDTRCTRYGVYQIQGVPGTGLLTINTATGCTSYRYMI